MKVTAEVANRNSEDDFKSKFGILSDAGAGVIHVRTQEPLRAANILRRSLVLSGNIYKEWDVVHGLRDYDVATVMGNPPSDLRTQDIHVAIAAPETMISSGEALDTDKVVYFVYMNPNFWLDGNPLLHHYLQQYAATLPMYDVRVVLITQDIPVPEELRDSVVTLHFDAPGHNELKDMLTNIVSSTDGVVELSEDEKDRICNTGAGMPKVGFEMYASLAIVEGLNGDELTADKIAAGVSKGKTEIVNTNDLLELYPEEDISSVGGMQNLKDWIAKRANCYTDEAHEYGIDPPKGMVLVGIPGSGKSLSAKAIAKEFGVPLIRLDFGRVFNSLVGSSEQRIRTALRMVDSMAPCVLFCDEIDKGLGGIGGSGDSGTSSRVLGTFLTWLNDSTAPVFTMVTANNVDGLPPELLRKGRFDATFATGFPNKEERLEVLNIHLEKRGWDAGSFSQADKDLVVNTSSGYVPAEIEAAVKDGLVDAFNDANQFTLDYVVQALGNMVPMSVSYNEEIQRMILWAKKNAMPASATLETGNEAASEKAKKVTRIRRTRGKNERTH